MRKVKLYTASSIDGFIARSDGSIDWLDAIPNPDKLDYGYVDFYNSVDVTLMGNTTYKKILGFDFEFPYHNTKNYVFSRTEKGTNEHVTFVSKKAGAFVKKLKKERGKDIWLIGGGELNTALLKEGLVDELIITFIPVVLGSGIPLFQATVKDHYFKLIKSRAFDNGIVQIRYVKQKS